MGLKLSNNAVSRLAAGISAGDLSLSVTPGTGALFPTLGAGDYFPATLVRASDSAVEIINVTARSTDVFTIERAQEGTTALAFIANDRVELRMTAATFSDEIARVETATATHAATSKTTPVDADEIPLVDSAASNVLKKLTWANLKAAIAAYFQLQPATRFTAGGTADAMTGTLSPAITSYTAPLRVTTTPGGANTVTGPTLNLNGIGAKTIKKRDSGGTKVALAAGDYNASGPFDFEYDGTDFLLLNPTPKEFSGNVKFPAAQVASSDPNTLDDYEEGTWTPGDSSGGGLSFSSVAATYEKIGRLVIARFAFTFPATADTNPVTISGLPFTTANNNSARQGFVSYSSETTAARLLVGANATLFQVTNTTGSPLTNAAMSTDTIFGAVIYYV